MSEKSNKIEQYILDHIEPEESYLTELNRKTFHTMLNPRMISGHLQGKVLMMFSKMIRPEKILEIGTFTGYSAICLSQGLEQGGKLYTIEINDEISHIAQEFFLKAGVGDKVEMIIGNALNIIPELNTLFDLIFIDGDKREYKDYYLCCKRYLKKGGFIIADNVLWDNKVIDDTGTHDENTKGIILFNELVQNDPDVENVLFRVRDGLMVIRKK